MIEAGSDATLTAAAFGSEPGSWPLPSAVTPRQRWLRAVAAGGQGRFATARGDLAALLRVRNTGPLASLAHSTQASFLRQLGWHTLARGYDGRALALAGTGPDAGEAAVDALTGLAADALGIGRFAASAVLLARAAAVPEVAGAARQRLAARRAWVTAELAMGTGDGPTAVYHAERARELVAGHDSMRHRIKTEVVLAAALCCAGRIGQAQIVADAALDAAEQLGLVPLQWALACLLGDTGSTIHTAQHIRAARDRCAQLVCRRGGTWRHR